MSSAKLRSEIIAARDQRQRLLVGHLSQGHPATVFVSLNIPGADKSPPGASALFSLVLRDLLIEFPETENFTRSCDSLGPFAVIPLDQEAILVKRRCIAMEAAYPFARLVDLDVFNGNGIQIDRASLGLSPRPCLVCDQAAVDCIRLWRHETEEVLRKTDELLAPFRN